MKSPSAAYRSPTKTDVQVARNTFQNGRFFGIQHATEPSFFGSVILQPKLQIGLPNDKYEKEADHIADIVTGFSGANAQSAGNHDGVLQMKCDGCRHEEEVQRKLIVQRQVNSSQAASPDISRKISLAKGSGQPLSGKTQQEMGAKMGADFGGIRVHTGRKAIQFNRELGSRAFTVGNHIFFNRGEYQPSSSTGKWLMAHELVHTIQQGLGMSSEKIQKQDDEEEQPLPRVPLPHELSREFYMNVLESSESEAVVESPSRRSSHSPRVRTRGSVDDSGRFRVRTRAQYKLAPDLTLGPLQFFETLSVESGVSGGSLEAIVGT